MTIYKNKFALTDDYLPDTLPNREDQIDYLTKHFSLVLKGLIPRHIFIHGAFGCGKTAVIRTVMNKIKEGCQDKLSLKIAHVHCQDKSTTFNLMQQISLQCSPSMMVSNTRRNLFLHLNNYLTETNSILILILDEMNKTPFKQIVPILHYFSRRGNTTGICISNNPQAMRDIPPDTHDSFRFTTYNFPPYNAKQLLEILKYRGKIALKKGVIGKGVLTYFSAIATGTGSARYAINLLASSAEQVEVEGGSKITEELAKKMPSYIEDKAFEESIITMPPYYKHIFLAYIKAKTTYDIPTPTVDNLYKAWCTTVASNSLKVLSKRRFRDFLTELKSKGFIEIIKHGKGRKRGWDYYVYVERLQEIIDIMAKKNQT